MLEQEENDDSLDGKFTLKALHRNMIIAVIIVTYTFLFLITLFDL
jgi:hypothetical protein